jgi:long-subunit acyl-CoA synthetase (AMP-forming)
MNSLLTSLRRQVLGNPRAIAIRSGDDSLSYAHLSIAIERAARLLQGCQAKSLGIYLDNGIDWIVADLAAMSAEIRVVPLPWFFSEEQIRHALADGAVDYLVHGGELPSAIVGTGSSLKLGAASWIQPVSAPDCIAGTDSLISGKLSYTSGTTGKPKGIDLAYDFIDQTCCSIGETISGLGIESHLSILPYATLLENIAGVYVPLMLGKTVYAEPAASIGLTAELRLDPDRLRRTFNRVQPGSLILTPQLLEVFCLLAENRLIEPGCLVFVAVGGARVGESLMQRARQAGIPAYEGYGLTEFGSVAMLNTPRHDRPGSVGKPLPGVSVSLAADGEICLGTRLTQTGAAPARTITVNTGDYGSIDSDGFVYVHGRKTNLIVLSSGRNVSPEWVETELNSSPLIAQSYVFSESEAELSVLLVAAVPGTLDSDLETEIERINQRLPAYARVKNWHRMPCAFSQDNQMLTVNGRLRRLQIKQALPALLANSRTYAPLNGGCPSQFSLQEINP